MDMDRSQGGVEELRLEAVGFYRELDPDGPSVYCGSIFEGIRESGDDDESEVVRYLENATAVLDVLDAPIDVVDGSVHIPGASSLLSDGKWVWRHDLIYYYSRYHLRLDEKFIERVRGRDYSPAAIEQIDKKEFARALRRFHTFRPSNIGELPPEVKELIARQRRAGPSSSGGA